METIAIDISESVFNKDTEAILYVTKDDEVEPAQYIFAIPVITFSWCAYDEKDLESFFPHSILGNKDKENKLLNEMKKL